MNYKEVKIHFIGIGGIGMSAIAEILLGLGGRVTGSDLAVNAQIERLQRLGAKISLGHAEKNLPSDASAVVYSSAVKMSNPELLLARRIGIPLIPRGEMLAELMRGKRGIAVAGSHGKTTTTGLIASVLQSSGADPTVIVGGRLASAGSNAVLGQGEWLLAEADESDGSFLRLSPELAVITNIDNDHLDHYGSFDKLQEAFKDFADRVSFYGSVIMCADDPYVHELSLSYTKRKLMYGFGEQAELTAQGIKFSGNAQSFEVWLRGRKLGVAEISLPGQHSVLNALAAFGIALGMNIDFSVAARGIQNFKGVDRRFQLKGDYRGAPIVDDYGHHPTEVLAALSGLKQMYSSKRLVVIFQPHRYSRTEICWGQFVHSFKDADHLHLMDIYAAGEQPIEGIHSRRLADEISKHHRAVQYWPSRQALIEHLKLHTSSEDVIVTLGAGDISKLGQEIQS